MMQRCKFMYGQLKDISNVKNESPLINLTKNKKIIKIKNKTSCHNRLKKYKYIFMYPLVTVTKCFTIKMMTTLIPKVVKLVTIENNLCIVHYSGG